MMDPGAALAVGRRSPALASPWPVAGLPPPASLLADISKGQLAGVIFFGGNVASDTQIAGVIGQLRRAQAQSPVQVPLLLMTDQEGGLTRRLPGTPALSV